MKRKVNKFSLEIPHSTHIKFSQKIGDDVQG